MDTKIETLEKLNKAEIVELFKAWIKQKPGLDKRNYYPQMYMMFREYDHISEQRKRAYNALSVFETRPYDPKILLDSLNHSFSGRLAIVEREGKPAMSYTTGQYWPTEYRLAAAVVLEHYNYETYPKFDGSIEFLPAIDQAARESLHGDRSEIPNAPIYIAGYDPYWKDYIVVPCGKAEYNHVMGWIHARNEHTQVRIVWSKSQLANIRGKKKCFPTWRYYALGIDVPTEQDSEINSLIAKQASRSTRVDKPSESA